MVLSHINPAFLNEIQDKQATRFPTGFSFRLATDDDAPAIRALFALTQKEYGFDYDFNGRESDLMEISNRYGQSGAFFGVLWDNANDTLAGMAALRQFENNKDASNKNNLETAELCRLYVYPEYRGQGLGRKLVQRITDLAEIMGYRRVVLESHTALLDALRLYKRAGFKEIPVYTQDDPNYSDFAAELLLR